MAAGRYAPSPTGRLHVGNLRTGLLAWLFARSAGSRFVLRIDDLDPERSRAEHERRQLEDLRAIGIEWDGEPLRQSARSGAYAEALDALERAGRVYPCWCTRAEVRAAARAPHSPPGTYPGTCRRLSSAERRARERSAPRPPALRLDARAEAVTFADRLHGEVTGTVDDVVLRRFDGTHAYNLAVVADDAHQGVEEVVRGDDLLAATPAQLLIARLLGLPEPAHAHVPLVVGRDGERLAKHHGAVQMDDPDAALAWMAQSIGLAMRGERVQAEHLLERFDPAALPREPAVFDPP